MSGPVVVILAAGRGTRMRSATPKLLHELCGRALLSWPVAAARAARASKIVVVDGPAGELAAALGDGIEVATQREARGTADAVRAAAAHIDPDGTVIVLNGDLPLIRSETIDELAVLRSGSGAGAVIATALLSDPSGYGRVIRAPDQTVERVVETKASGDATELELQIGEVNAGAYAFDGSALLGALEAVGADNAQGECYLPDVLAILRQRAHTVLGHQIADPEDMLGVNDRADLAAVRAIAQQRIHHRHMLAGVTIVDPPSTVVDVDVSLAADVEIAPFTSLHGLTEVGAGSVIGPHSTLVDTRVGREAKVLHAYCLEAEVGDRVSVGPFAYLRPGAVLRERSKVGTFVEVKNSELGAGSKIPHLSYIGDADIGEGSNLGASTITANYDGQRKHRTRIGSGVKTSVDTTLVAPVELGDDTYTGAGSVITDDVPDGALGIARSRQRNIGGYADRRREPR